MSSNDSVCRLIEAIKAGNDDAAEELWQCYFPRLVEIARRRLASQRDPMIDGEDVALSVLDSFIEAARDDRFPELQDREGLWRLLRKMAFRKAIDVIRHNNCGKRKGAYESDLGIVSTESGMVQPMTHVRGNEPEPDWNVIMKESMQELLAQLNDPQREAIALMKLEGHTNKQIAARIDRSVPNVELKLRIIRKIWKDYRPPSSDEQAANH